jgi:hypothetical protein
LPASQKEQVLPVYPEIAWNCPAGQLVQERSIIADGVEPLVPFSHVDQSVHPTDAAAFCDW